MVFEIFHDHDVNHDNRIYRNELHNVLIALGDHIITKHEVGILVYIA